MNGEPEQELVSVAAGARGDAGALVRRVAALWRHGLALGAGALLACAFAPQGWWPLAFISPAVLILLWERATPRRAAWLGFWFGFGLFAAGTYWLYGSLNLMAQITRSPSGRARAAAGRGAAGKDSTLVG